jgi:hypothetical protein
LPVSSAGDKKAALDLAISEIKNSAVAKIVGVIERLEEGPLWEHPATGYLEAS